jgi:hypothetical protein
MSAVPLGKAGVGSAMNDVTRELGGALGVAVLGSLVASRYDSLISGVISNLTGSAHSTADASLSGALEVGGRIGGAEGQRIVDTARDAYTSGMNTATLVGAIVAAIGAVIVYRKLPTTRPAIAPVTPEARAVEIAEVD